MSLTICFVVYNEEKNLSLIEQNLKTLRLSGEKIQILIVDNGSVDGSSLRLEILAKMYQCTYIRRDDNHLPKARHQALEWATTSWVGYVDADCRISSKWAHVALKKIARDIKPIVAFGGPWKVAGDWSALYRSLFGSFFGHFGLPYLIPQSDGEKIVEHLPTANIVYNRAALLEVGGFSSTNPYVGEDLDVSCRFEKQRSLMLLEPEMAVDHFLPDQWGRWTRKMFFYGSARGRSLWIYPSLFKLKSLLPFFFCLFLLLSSTGTYPPMLGVFVFYLVVCLGVSVVCSQASDSIKVFALMLTTHFFYSWGVVFGFLQIGLSSVLLRPTDGPPNHKWPKVESV